MPKGHVNPYPASLRGPQPSLLNWLALAVLVAACGLAALNLGSGLPGDFILDDHARVKHADVDELDARAILHSILETDSGVFGRVLPLASLYATKAIYGADAAPFKVENILFHLLTGIVLFWFLYHLLSTRYLRRFIDPEYHWLFASIVTAIWLLHPLQVSTALYIVQRMTQFSMLFVLLALICYIRARTHLYTDARRALLPSAGILVFLVAGLLSKESAALLPFFILLIECFAFRFDGLRGSLRRPLSIMLSIFVVLPTLAGALYFATHTDTLLHDYAMRPFSLGERIATETVIVWQYVGMIVLPRLSELALYHDGLRILSWTSPAFLASAAGWILLLASLYYLRNRAPLFTFGICFFIVSHLLESTVLPLELMFEHRNYLGSTGIILALASLVPFRNQDQRTPNTIALLALVLVIGGLGALQYARASAWSDPYAYAIIAADENPRSARAASTLANYQARRGQLDEARQILRNSIELRSNDASVSGLYLHLAMFYCFEDEIPPPILDDTHSALTRYPVSSYALTGLKVLRQRMLEGECPALTRQTLLFLESAAADNTQTRLEYRFFFNGMAGVSSAELGHHEAARTYFRNALSHRKYISPITLRDTLIALAQVCITSGDRDCASGAIEQARLQDQALRDLVGRHPRLGQIIDSFEDTFGDDGN